MNLDYMRFHVCLGIEEDYEEIRTGIGAWYEGPDNSFYINVTLKNNLNRFLKAVDFLSIIKK